jgi:UDP-glucose 4-epimerase
MRILVTGGAGFISSHLVEACVAQGNQVAIVDDVSAGAAPAVPAGVRAYRVDVRRGELHDVFAAERPELVSHQAARLHGRRAVDDPIRDAEVTVLGSLNVMDAARRHGVRRIVLASTASAIYNEPRGSTDETRRGRPRTSDAVAMLAVEHYLADYATTGGLESIILRYADVYGPRQNPRHEPGVVAIFIERILAGLAPTVFGTGAQVRDFVDVDDVVRANLAAQTIAVAGGEPAVFNVGTGRGTSIHALCRALGDIAGARIAPVYAPAPPGDLARCVLDVTRARRALGWEPSITLEQGLARTWAWFAAHTRESSRAAA